jgi:hypothetical protein
LIYQYYKLLPGLYQSTIARPTTLTRTSILDKE